VLVTAEDKGGVGIGLRQPHYGAMLRDRPELGFVELHSENFFADGGAALAVLHAARQCWPISLHGVGLSLGSAAALAGAAVCAWVLLKLPQGERQRLGLGRLAAVYGQTLRDPAFMLPALVGAGAMGAISAFFGASPRLFIDTLAVTPVEYGLYPPIAVTGFVVGGVLVRRRGAIGAPRARCCAAWSSSWAGLRCSSARRCWAGCSRGS
jgi:hypothetical protein